MKKMTLLLMLFCASVFAQSNLTSELLLHYKFDGNVKDVSRNNYDGIVSDITYKKGRKGVSDSIAYFDGLNDYIDLPNIEALKPSLPLTIALWANFDNLSNEQSVLFATDFQENNQSGFWASLSNNKIAISYGDAQGNSSTENTRTKTGTTELITNKWYHFVFVIRGKLDMDIYINGVNDGGFYSGKSNNELGYTSNSGSIGRNGYNVDLSTDYFKGGMDEFRYWSTDLSSEIVEILYNIEALAIEEYQNNITEDLLLHYKFDGNAKDFSGNNYDGIVSDVKYTEDRNGNINSSASFDGIDDFIDMPNITTLKPNLPLSISFWIKYESNNTNDRAVFNTSFEENRNTGVFFTEQSSTGKFGLGFGDGTYNYSSSTRRSYISNTAIETNVWQHIAIVVKSNSDMKIYVNNVENGGDYSGRGGALIYSTTSGTIGRHDQDSNLSAYHFKGQIDEFKYWNKELSVDEISLDYNLNFAQEVLNKETNKIFVNDLKLFFNTLTRELLFLNNIENYNHISVFNSLGQNVFDSNIIEQSINLSSLINGIYYLRIKKENKTIMKKIIIH